MSKSRDIADSAATINYIDGLTSDAQTQLDGKATLSSSPTFTGTVTATAFSGDGSGLTGVDSLPSQSGNSGKFLTTDGSTASWAAGAVTPLNLTLISGQNFADTNATEISFTNLDNSYDYYLLFTNALELGTQVNPDLHLSSNNGSTYSYDGADTNYRAYMGRQATPWDGSADADNNRIWLNSNKVTAFTYLYGIGNSETVRFTTWYHTFDDSSNFGWQLGKANNTTNNINALRYRFNATATNGAVYLYGVTI